MSRTLLISVLIALVALAACAPGRDRARVSEEPGAVPWIQSPFRAHAGDQASWAAPDLDDRDWPLVDPALFPGTSVPAWAGIGWFRAWVEVSAEMASRPAPLYGRYVGAAEIFVDGVRQFGVGDPGVVSASGTTPVEFQLERPGWIRFSGPGRHLIAVRFASLDVAAMQRVGFPGGFQLALASKPLDPAGGRQSSLVRAAFIGATVALAILHLLLFLFHRHRRENLEYALAALLIAGILLSQEALRWATSTTEVWMSLAAFAATICLSTVLLLRFYYSVFAPSVPRRYWVMLAVAVGLALTAGTMPRIVYYGFAMVVCLEQARVLVAAVLRRAARAWIIGVGGVVWMSSAVYQMLGDAGALPELPNAYLYGFFTLLVSISIYLARDIAADRADLARKLVEIEELSQKERRAMQRMFRADKMAALGQIVAGVAHEINNPNNFIHFNLPILRKYVDAMRPHLDAELAKDPGAKVLGMPVEEFLADLFKLIENMEHGSQRITAIVADLRNYVRSGEDVEMKVGSIAPVIERVMALAGRQVGKMVKTLDVVVDPDLPSVKMSAGKIEQVLINLLINAGQAADKEDSRVSLTARAVDGGSAVEIRVEDNGVGIPAESLEQIFEPFYTSKGRDTGTGLGLSISQQIVEEHHGRIEVTSELGKGSCFTVHLPAASAP